MAINLDVPALLDPYLIPLYRFTGYTILDYFIGTLLLSMMAVLLGELTLSLALRINRRYIQGMENELTKQHELSVTALHQEDRKAYKACNDQANDAFGKYFFSMIAYSAAYLWPIPFLMTWMQSRFWAVKFELVYPISLVWSSTGYFTTFFLCYVLSRILFKNMRRYLPYFRGVQQMIDFHADRSETESRPVSGSESLQKAG